VSGGTFFFSAESNCVFFVCWLLLLQGLTVDSATEFCESLLSPYSDRFLWAGSTVCGPSVVVTNHFEKFSSHHHQHHHHNYGGYHHQTRKSSSSANSPQQQSSTTSDYRNKKKTFLLTGHSAAAPTATAATTTTITTIPKGHGKHGMEEFRAHCNEQPQGLQVLLA
jgi:hypothetical protein